MYQTSVTKQLRKYSSKSGFLNRAVVQGPLAMPIWGVSAAGFRRKGCPNTTSSEFANFTSRHTLSSFRAVTKIKHSFYKNKKDIPASTNCLRSSTFHNCHATERPSSGHKVSREITLARRNDLHQPKGSALRPPIKQPSRPHC